MKPFSNKAKKILNNVYAWFVYIKVSTNSSLWEWRQAIRTPLKQASSLSHFLVQHFFANTLLHFQISSFLRQAQDLEIFVHNIDSTVQYAALVTWQGVKTAYIVQMQRLIKQRMHALEQSKKVCYFNCELPWHFCSPKSQHETSFPIVLFGGLGVFPRIPELSLTYSQSTC